MPPPPCRPPEPAVARRPAARAMPAAAAPRPVDEPDLTRAVAPLRALARRRRWLAGLLRENRSLWRTPDDTARPRLRWGVWIPATPAQCPTLDHDRDRPVPGRAARRFPTSDG